MRVSTGVAHAVLGLSLVVAAPLAACGGGGGQASGPQVPSATPSGTGAPSASVAPSASATAPVPSASASAEHEHEHGPMQPVTASAMGDELEAIGLDPAKLPPLDKLQPNKLRKVMKTFSKSLGVKCTGCHDANDFHAPTKNKKIAARMWSDFVLGMTMQDGSLLYCDSCHHGSKEFLDRSDLKALGKWMDANFVAKLKSTGAKASEDVECATCHGDPFEGDFLDDWAK